MRTRRFTFLLIGIMILCGVLVLGQAHRPVAAQGGNLLTNPDFEAGVYTFDPDDYNWVALYPSQREDCKNNQGAYLPCGTANAPVGWIPWWISQAPADPPWKNRMPEYKPARAPFFNRIHSGNEASQYFSFQGTHTAGLLQVVTVPATAQLRFSIWGQAWSTIDDSEYSNQPTTVNMRIGIDPTGGTNPYSPAIVWSSYQQPYDIYSQFVVEAQAQGDQVTVFTISNPAEQRKHNDIYWDNAELVVMGEGAAPPPAAPPPSNDNGGGGAVVAPVIPATAATATPNAEGVIYAEVRAGDSFWSIAARHGLTIDEIYALNDAGPGTTISVGDLLVVGSGPPGGVEEVAEAAEEEPAAEPTVEPTPAPTATPEPSGGTVCLTAFLDPNQNGQQDPGEELKAAVAFTISNSETVVMNYVTDGFSEPYCIRGLDSGNYQITRSIGPNEQLTTAGDWTVSVSNDTESIFAFGSYVGDPADAVADTAALAANSAGTTGTGGAESTGAENAAADSDSDSDGTIAGGLGLGLILVVVVVGLVLLLLFGVIILVVSGRR